MRLEKLSLKGITRFADPVSIDFASLPPGLVAIVGENGAGKTTVLDACLAAIFRTLPSRGDKPLIDYATGKDAYLDEVFVVGGIRYRARVSMDAVTRKADAVLQRELDGQWVNLNDGKVSTFTTAVAERFPPLSVVLASAFAAQNKAGSFLTMDKAKRKDLFASLLGLAHYEQMAQRCRDKASALDRRRAELRALLERLEAELTPEAEEAISETGNTIAAALVEAQTERDRLAGETDRLTAAAATAREKHEQARQTVWQRESVTAQLRAFRDAHAKITADLAKIDEDLLAATDQIARRRVHDLGAKRAAIASLPSHGTIDQDHADAVSARRARHEGELYAIDQKIANNRAELLDKAADIRAAAAAIAEANALIASCRKDADELRDQIAEAEGAAKVVETERQTLLRAIDRLSAAKSAAALIDVVPCGGKPPYDGCSLLTHAKEAKAQIPELEAKELSVQALDEVLANHRASIDEKKARIFTLNQRASGQGLTLDISKGLADRLPFLEVAEQRIQELEASKATATSQLDADLADIRRQFDDRRASVTASRLQYENEIAAIEARADEDLRAVQVTAAANREQTTTQLFELDAKIHDAEATLVATAVANETYQAALAAMTAADQALAAHHGAVAQNAARLATIEGERKNFEQLRARFHQMQREAEDYRTQLVPVERDQVEFEVLAKCFGREGLPVLEIDAAGPAVSDLCNDLLRSCFGSSRFTVELVTQTPKADGKGFKEVFEIRVWDAERGGEARDLTDLSGGEQVLVDESIKSAIALYMNQQNVTPFQTCFRDETTGALDPENAIRYVGMLRRLQERGRYHHVIYISHNPDAAALADVQLVVADGQVTVRHAPFEVAA